jgi:hypothetical protein
MPRTIPNEKITRIGEVAKGEIEFFKIAVTLLPRQKEAFRANKSKYLWKLFERHSYKVNNFYVTTAFEKKVDKLLDKTPADEDVSIDAIVWHVAQVGIYKRSTYI